MIYHEGIFLQEAESAFVVINFPALELVKMLNRPAKDSEERRGYICIWRTL